jgi:heptosyltransferase-2
VAKFLIIRFSSIGDIVLTTPVIRCLKTQVEAAEVHYLTKQQFGPVLKDNPYIDKLWFYTKEKHNELIRALQQEHFDFVIDLHHNLRTLRFKRKLKLLSFSFNKLNVEKWLLVNFGINKLPDVHIVDRYLKTVELFDVKNDGKGLEYYISEEDRALPPEIQKELPENYHALVIGGQHFTKKAPAAKLALLCRKLQLPVVILGGKEDKPEADKITAEVTDNVVVNLAGVLSLQQSAYLVSRAATVITHDTGLMHIAAAFRKKVISIWGNTIPEFGMYPYQPHPASRIFEVKGLKCRPCSKIGFTKCPKGHFNCMNMQDFEEVARYANAVAAQRE